MRNFKSILLALAVSGVVVGCDNGSGLITDRNAQPQSLTETVAVEVDIHTDEVSTPVDPDSPLILSDNSDDSETALPIPTE